MTKYYQIFNFFKNLSSIVIFAICFAFLFQSFLFQPFKIPSSSMEPNLKIGDYLFVEKFSYNYNINSFSFYINRFRLWNGIIKFNNPKRGDVIVFFSNFLNNNKYYIKRIVGIPGDKIQFKNGRLIINDKIIYNVVININDDYLLIKEVLKNNITYNIQINKQFNPLSIFNTTIIYYIPKHYYFLIGDNRNNSRDSKVLEEMGYINEKNIIGKAKFIFWNSLILNKSDYNKFILKIK